MLRTWSLDSKKSTQSAICRCNSTAVSLTQSNRRSIFWFANGSQQPRRGASKVITGADSARVATIVLVFIFRDAQREDQHKNHTRNLAFPWSFAVSWGYHWHLDYLIKHLRGLSEHLQVLSVCQKEHAFDGNQQCLHFQSNEISYPGSDALAPQSKTFPTTCMNLK